MTHVRLSSLKLPSVRLRPDDSYDNTKLKADIEAHGITRALKVDGRDMVIYDGIRRYEALIELYGSSHDVSVPVVMV